MSEETLEYVQGSFAKDLVKYKGTVLRGDPRIYADDVDNFEIRDDDVWLFGFMRSGTHWASELIWRVANENLESTESQRARFPWFDAVIEPNYLMESKKTYDEVMSELNNLPSPRFLRTHLPFHLLPRGLRTGEKKPKMVYIARNPKDVCVSLYYCLKHFYNFQGSLEELCDLFITDKVSYAPYWENLLSFWQKRNDIDILFLKYEDMKRDLASVIRRTGDYFGKTLTEEQVAALSKHLSFENYSKDPALTYQNVDDIYTERFGHKESKGIVRKGTMDQWKEEMSAETVQRLDQWIEENLRNSDYVL